ncbi:uncharacterized protein J3R85_018516 [Psidium guajava]|nr:uncharacterized protein J3R85_018516 [Psidium guajava]
MAVKLKATEHEVVELQRLRGEDLARMASSTGSGASKSRGDGPSVFVELDVVAKEAMVAFKGELCLRGGDVQGRRGRRRRLQWLAFLS